MRKIILLLFAVAILMGCATTYYDSEGNPVPEGANGNVEGESGTCAFARSSLSCVC